MVQAGLSAVLDIAGVMAGGRMLE